MMKKYWWRGEWVNDQQLEEILIALNAHNTNDATDAININNVNIVNNVNNESGKLSQWLKCLGQFNLKLLWNTLDNLKSKLALNSSHEFPPEIQEFLSSDLLALKMKRELALNTLHDNPRVLNRVNNSRGEGEDAEGAANVIFERWQPLGVITHITSGNAPGVGALSVIESLLLGNINILKASSEDTLSLRLLSELIAADESGVLKDFICVLNLSSSIAKDKELLQKVCSISDGVVVWGGEDALSAIKAVTPRSARLISYGPKISFAYLSIGEALKSSLEAAIAAVVADVILLEQQACSSPQILYVDCAASNQQYLNYIGELCAKFLEKLSQAHGDGRDSHDGHIDMHAWAGISITKEIHKLESLMGQGILLEDKSGQQAWRVLVSYDSRIVASPLYRTLWVKPLPSKDIVKVLHPHRFFLQSVGLAVAATADTSADTATATGTTISAAATADIMQELCEQFYTAGILRITPVGKMHQSYFGEPHDGEWALTRYARRVSLQLPSNHEWGQRLFIDMIHDMTNKATDSDTSEIVTKEKFSALAELSGRKRPIGSKLGNQRAQLYFKSGGSSGKAKLSTFSYDDYHFQMLCAGDGLLAAGLDPKRDRIMNLFYSGGLYGGFLSFHTILETLRARHWPMAAHEDLAMVAETIVNQEIDTLLGMPSYICNLFRSPRDHEQKARLQEYCRKGGIKKIFYGGEPFTSQQQNCLSEEWGIKLIKSASYGSVDAGPLGYQCQHCQGGVHHLQERLQRLEILKMDSNQNVVGDEVGRLIFTSLARESLPPMRYEIGDLGRWVTSQDGQQQRCSCGRSAELFVLLGRYGDIFKAGGSFLNYQKILQIISNYLPEVMMQLLLTQEQGVDKINILLNELPHLDHPHHLHRPHRSSLASEQDFAKVIINEYHDLQEVYLEGLLKLQLQVVKAEDFAYSAASGKLLRVIDNRNLGVNLGAKLK